MTLGEVIKQYREENSLSMDDFAARSGFSKAYVSLLERNYNPKTGKPISPSLQTIKASADAMRMDFDHLFGMLDGNVVVKNKSLPSDYLTFDVTPLNDGFRKRLEAYYQKLLDLQRMESE